MKRQYPIFLLVGIIILFFLPLFISSSIWGFRDFHRYVYPIRYFGRECILSGFIPFWNPYIGCGMPYFAGLQGMVFYPPSIFIYLFPYEIGLKLFVIFHYTIACISMYLLAIKLGLSKPSSFISGIVWGLSGWLVSSLDIPIILCSSSWCPFIFLFILKSHPVIAGVFLSFQILSGEPSVFYLTSFSVLLFSLYMRIKLILPIISILFSLAFSLFQLLPFLEFLSYSTRIGQLYAEGTQWQFFPYEILRFILPSACGGIVRGEEEPAVFFGQLWLKSPYVGIVPFILGTTAILLPRKNKPIFFFSILFLLSVILSFGNYTPLYKLLYNYLPLFSLMRYPVKLLLFGSLSISILAGFGMEYILFLNKNSLRLFIFQGLLVIFLFTLVFFEEAKVFSLFSLTSYKLLNWWTNVLLDGFFIIALIFITIVFLFLYRFSIITIKAFILGVIGIIIIDLFFFQDKLNPLVDRYVYDKNQTVMFLEEYKGYFRIMATPQTNQFFTKIRGKTLTDAIDNARKFIIPNNCMVFGLYDAGAYDSFYLSDYFRLKREVSKSRFSSALKVLSLLNIRFIISKGPIFAEEVNLVYIDKDMFLYENPNFLERAFFVPSYKAMDKKKILKYMLSPQFDPEKEVILEEEVEKVKSQKSKIKSNVKIIKYEPNRVAIEVEAEEPGFLFLSDTYYPGWKAYVKKEERKIYKANYCFRAVWVDKGKQIVEFRYIPRAFIIGLIGSIVSCIILAILKQ